MNVIVKSCPFCGSKPKITSLLIGTPYEYHFVKCANENCECEIKNPSKTIEDAITIWNRRRIFAEKRFDITDVVEKTKDIEPPVDLPMDKISLLQNEITEKFGEQSLWTALILIQMINKESWKFDDGMIQSAQKIKDIMQYIEESKTIKELFSIKENEARDV